MFILITPLKNEEAYIKKTASAVIAQTMKPALWIIVDDGSTDTSPEIIKDLEREYLWIKSIRLPEHPRDLTSHISYVCKSGIEFAIEYCVQNSIEYQYIGLLDADTYLQKDYFEKLIQEFKKDQYLGIASGCLIDQVEGFDQLPETEWRELRSNSANRVMPRGSGRLWRKKCYFETGGCPLEPEWDTISNIKASAHGWKITQFNHIRAIQLRPTSSAEGVWKGYLINGEMAHYLNKPFILVLGGVAYFSLNWPYFQGLPYLLGYISAVFQRKPKIEDNDVKEFWKKRVRSIIHR